METLRKAALVRGAAIGGLATTTQTGPNSSDLKTILSTGAQTALTQPQIIPAPVAGLADYGSAAVSALTVSATAVTGNSNPSSSSYYYAFNVFDITPTYTNTFAYSGGGVILADISGGDSLAPYALMTENPTDAIRVYSTSGFVPNLSDVSYEFMLRDYANYSGLIYSTYGTWTRAVISAATYMTFGAFSSGVPTPLAQMPSSGTATYSGGATGFLVAATGAGYNVASLIGTSALTANFGSGTISGSLAFPGSNNQALIAATNGGMSGLTIALNSTSFRGGTSFTGSASTTALSNSSGSYSGAFYGASAAEVAGTAQVSGGFIYPTVGENPAKVIASYGAKK